MSREKLWRVAFDPENSEKIDIVRCLSEGLSISKAAAVVLLNRGYETAEDAESFIKNETVILHDPFLLPDMGKGAAILVDAIDKKKKITVYGDYDADGVTSTALMCKYFKSKGADISYYIPDRKTEGYGMNIGSVEKLFADGTEVILTVDNGITALDERKHAKELGMTVVVTDHHSPHDTLTSADALIDPWLSESRYPFFELAGVGVAFKFISAVETIFRRRDGGDLLAAITELCKTYTDLVAIGTVADVMPIRDENRLLTAMGLYILKNRPSFGMDALMYASSLGDTISASNPEYYVSKPRETQKRKINTVYLSFVIAPRINASGRVTHAYDALRLLLSEDAKDAMRRAVALCEINTKRKSIENMIGDDAIFEIEKNGAPTHKIIVMESDTWKNGVVGIVASRLMEKYNLPVVLVSFDDGIIDDTPSPLDVGKGSCRSIKGFNIHDALNSCEDLFVRYGGHEMAAGLTIYRKDFEEFKERVERYADENFDEGKTTQSIDIDCTLDFSETTIDTAEEIGSFEPFGVGNPEPVFATFGARVKEVRSLSQGKFAKLILDDGKAPMSAVCFVYSYDSLPVYNGEIADVAYTLEVNEYKGFRSPQLTIKDLRLSAEYKKELLESVDRVLRFADGEDILFGGDYIPDRQDFAVLYSYLKNQAQKGFSSFSLRRAAGMLRDDGHRGIECWKIVLISKIFEELGLLSLSFLNDDIISFEIKSVAEKADLQSAQLLKRYIKLRES